MDTVFETFVAFYCRLVDILNNKSSVLRGKARSILMPYGGSLLIARAGILWELPFKEKNRPVKSLPLIPPPQQCRKLLIFE